MDGYLSNFIIVITIFTTVNGNVHLNYELTEEEPAGNFVGNIAIDGQLRRNLSNEEFNNLRFSLLPQRNSHFKLFSVDERRGILDTAAKLDRENLCGQAVICTVNMSVATLSTLTDFFQVFNVSIIVKDTNDNRPVFPNPNMQLTFSESASVGDSFQIQPAVDQDIGVNAEITYELQGSDGTFGLQHDKSPNGISDLRVVVNRLLDHETSQQQQVTLVARDGGVPVNIATATITIRITDINDHIPIFTELLYTQRILENTPIKTTLLQVSAKDLDQGINGKVSYFFPTLTTNNIRDMFSLNSTTGDLILQQLLDFENVQSFTFQIEARDGGSPSKISQTNVAITVLDVNDNAPSISFNIPAGQDSISVPESLKPGDFLTQMSVFDGDTGKGGQVTCKLADYRFRIKNIFGSEFKILLNSTLNRETESVVNLTVTCTDMGASPKQDIKSLMIRVEDVNDGVPTFPQDWYYLTLTENPNDGDLIMKANAEDKDLGEAGRISYKINAIGGQYFQVLTNGDIIVSNTIDRERTPEIVFDIIATDNAEPFHSSTATVKVTVLDENDEEPDFGTSNPMTSVSENLPAGTSVSLITATDPDLGPGGIVSYNLLPDDPEIPFTVDSVSGKITTTRELNREEQSIYKLVLQATDKGTPQQTGRLELTITVSDKNDNKPAFTFPNESNNTVNIYNSHKLGRTVTVVKARDFDDKNNSKLEYKFKSTGTPYDYFNLDSETGAITLAKPLSNRGKQTLELLVSVSDQGTPKLSSESRLFVVVSQDNRPLPMPDGLSGRTNLTIAICILAVSAIVSATIVIIICLVRRRGNKQPDLTNKGEAPKSEKTWNSLYDVKKNSTADIIINREGASQLHQVNLQPVPSQLEKDDVMFKHHESTNPTFQIFPAQEPYPAKMGYTEDILGKSDGQSNSSTGDSGRGLSQDDIQWLHHHQDFDHMHSLEEERFSQTSIPSNDLTGSDQMSHDYRWQGQRLPPHLSHQSHNVHSSPSGHSGRSYQIGKISPSITSGYNSTFS